MAYRTTTSAGGASPARFLTPVHTSTSKSSPRPHQLSPLFPPPLTATTNDEYYHRFTEVTGGPTRSFTFPHYDPPPVPPSSAENFDDDNDDDDILVVQKDEQQQNGRGSAMTTRRTTTCSINNQYHESDLQHHLHRHHPRQSSQQHSDNTATTNNGGVGSSEGEYRSSGRGGGSSTCMMTMNPHPVSPSDHFNGSTLWEIIQTSAHPNVQNEALRVIFENTSPCGKANTRGIVRYYSNRYGTQHWHCIAGSHSTAWRVWYDEPSMIWVESPNQRLALFRRKPVSHLLETMSSEMQDKFRKICEKAQKKWMKKKSIQRPLQVREELWKRFGGYWHVVVGRCEEFTISSTKEERQNEMEVVLNPFLFIAWLG